MIGLMLGLLILLSSRAMAEERYDCLIEPNMVVDVSSSVEGVVERVHIDRSDSVEKGELLVELEAGVEIAAVNKARARTHMQGELQSRQSSLEFAERRLERINKLFKKGLVSSNDLDEAETQVRLARAELHKAEDEQKLAKLELQRAREALKLRRIRSPFAGVVMERYKSPGESVEDKPILRLAQLDPLRVEMYLPATEFGQIEPGRYANVIPETSTSAEYLAEVKLVDRVIDSASGTFSIRLEIPNPEHKIPGGLRCKLKFLSSSESAAIRKQQSRLKPDPVEKDKSAYANKRSPTSEDLDLIVDETRESEVVESAALDVDALPVCWSVGPVSDMERLERIDDALSPFVTYLSHRETEESSKSRYLVLSPRQPSLSKARELANLVREKGFRDIAALDDGSYDKHVSYGIYRRLVLARDHVEELRQNQIEADIIPLTDGQQYWLDIEVNPQSMDEERLNRILEQYQPELQISERSCQSAFVNKVSISTMVEPV